MADLLTFLKSRCDGDLLPWSAQLAAAQRFGLGLAEVETEALENDILPARYQRNRSIISCWDQLRLFRSRVAVIGCGGLGGYVLEELARLGVGQIIAVDPDTFEEHNLNRQLLSSPFELGRPKVAVASDRVARINPAVTLIPCEEAFGADNGRSLLEGVQVAVDGLDNIEVRLQLSRICEELAIPLVHGAIAGWFGQVTTQFPAERVLESIYRPGSADKGAEKELGNPSFTPAVIASLEVAEVCKTLLGKGELLRGRALSIDLLGMEFTESRW